MPFKLKEFFFNFSAFPNSLEPNVLKAFAVLFFLRPQSAYLRGTEIRLKRLG